MNSKLLSSGRDKLSTLKINKKLFVAVVVDVIVADVFLLVLLLLF